MVHTLEKLLPLPVEHIELLCNTEQNPHFHAEGNVYKHMCYVLEQYETHADNFDLDDTDREVLYWAALLHDIGKPVVTQWVNGRLTAKGHERAGVPIARDILLNQPEITTRQRQRILDLVRLHHIPLKWGMRKARLSEYKRLATATDLRLMGIFSLFDIMGRVCINKPETLEMISHFNEVIVSRIRDEIGAFESLQEQYQKAGYQKKNALWHALKYDDDRLLEKVLHHNNPETIPPKSQCVITIGAPRSGKTEYVQAHYPDHHYFDLEAYKVRQGHSDENEYALDIKTFMSAFLRQHRNIVIDGCNLNPDTRRRIGDCARDFHAELHYLYFERSLDHLLETNAHTAQPLASDRIRAAHNTLDIPHPWEAHSLQIID